MSYVLEGPPLEVSNTSILQDIYENMKCSPKKVLFEETETHKKFTNEEVLLDALSVVERLQTLRIQRGEIVTLCADSNMCKSYSVLLGVWFSGVTACPISPVSTVNEIQQYLEFTHSVAIFADDKYMDKIKMAVQKLDWTVLILPIYEKPSNCDYCLSRQTDRSTDVKNYTGDHLMCILFTSGTSGVPKGVKLSAEGLKVSLSSFPFCENKRILVTTPLFWISNVYTLLRTLSTRGIFVILNSSSSENVLKIITTYKPEILFCGVTILMDMCYADNLQKYNTTSLEEIYTTGSFLMLKNKRLIVKKVLGGRDIIRVFYGSTEAGMVSMMKDPDNSTKRYESIGKAVIGAKIKIVNVETGKMVGPFEHGEICAKSRSITKGYIQRPPLKEELDDEAWWHLGDCGYYDEEGYLYYVTRFKEIIICRGEHVIPTVLEGIIQEHPDVMECCVVGKPHDIDVEQAAAFVVKTSSSKLTEQDIYNLVSQHVFLPEENLKGGVYFVKTLPKSPVGKLLRKDVLRLNCPEALDRSS